MIVSLQNKLIKEINHLKSAKGRKSEGLYLLEGIKPVIESIQAGKSKEIITCPDLLTHQKLPNHPHITEVSEKVFNHLTTMEHPEGVVSINPMQRLTLSDLKTDAFLVLCGVQDPGNTGSLIRSADAFGFNQIIFLPENADPFSPKATRASMGSILRIRAHFATEVELIDWVKKAGCQLWGLDCRGQQEKFTKQDLSQMFGLLIGSESHGISKSLADNLTKKIKIPMSANIESLNAAIAGSIVMHDIFTKRSL